MYHRRGYHALAHWQQETLGFRKFTYFVCHTIRPQESLFNRMWCARKLLVSLRINVLCVNLVKQHGFLYASPLLLLLSYITLRFKFMMMFQFKAVIIAGVLDNETYWKQWVVIKNSLLPQLECTQSVHTCKMYSFKIYFT